MYIQKFKPDFLRSYSADLNQIFYESFQVQGNENLMTWCWSHDQDGYHAHIWEKPFKNLLFRNRRADFHETWYEVSGTPAHHSLFKWWPSSDLDLFYGKVKFGNLGFSIGKSENSGFFWNYCSQWPYTDGFNENMWVLAQGRVQTKIQTEFSQKLLCWSEANFVWKLLSTRKWKSDGIMLVMWPRWPPDDAHI